jgi:hypothetical protein
MGEGWGGGAAKNTMLNASDSLEEGALKFAKLQQSDRRYAGYRYDITLLSLWQEVGADFS